MRHAHKIQSVLRMGRSTVDLRTAKANRVRDDGSQVNFLNVEQNGNVEGALYFILNYDHQSSPKNSWCYYLRLLAVMSRLKLHGM